MLFKNKTIKFEYFICKINVCMDLFRKQSNPTVVLKDTFFMNEKKRFSKLHRKRYAVDNKNNNNSFYKIDFHYLFVLQLN